MSAKNGVTERQCWNEREEALIQLIAKHGKHIIPERHYLQPITPDTRITGQMASEVSKFVRESLKRHPKFTCSGIVTDTRGITLREIAECLVTRA